MVNQAVHESFEQLKPWMAWAQNLPTLDDSEEAMRKLSIAALERTELAFVFLHNNRLVGMGSYHHIEWEVPSARIGYWVRTSEQGKGYITEAVAALTKYAFDHMGIKRLAIWCDDENSKSAAVAERLGYTLEVKARGLFPKPGCQDLRLIRCYVRFDASGLEKFTVSLPNSDIIHEPVPLRTTT
jgi:RimJ/RimL family protein N-acetyltransferase